MISKCSKKLAFLAAVALTGAVLAGCGGQDAGKKAASSVSAVTWTEKLDGKTTEFKVTAPPKHAVSMSQATTEMMLALGLEDQMAGTAFKEEDIYEPLQQAYAKVPVLAEKWPSYEKLMSVKPDFVTGWEVPFTKRGIPAKQIEAQHIPIYVPDSMQSTKADLNTLFNDMETLGDIFGKKDKARTWVDSEKKKLSAVQDKIKNLPHKKVFVFDSEDTDPFTAFEGYTTNILKMVGADNVMSGKGVDKTWAKTSWENVVAANPDYILIVDYGVSIRNDDDYQKKVAKLKANPQLAAVNAVKDNHFIRVKLSEITPGVRTVDALERIAKEIHGDNQ